MVDAARARPGTCWRLRVVRLVLACAMLGLAPWSAAAPAALEIIDDRGKRVRLERPPQRIVSILPSLTEMVCDLGQCARLVGVDRYSNHPASVKMLPRVGGGLDPNIEAVLALRPDLVLLATSSSAAARLESLGLKVAALEPRRYADVQRVLLEVGRILGVPGAQGVWQGIEAGVLAAADALPAGSRGKRVYFEVNNAPYAAGDASFIGETLRRLGQVNIVPADLGPFPRINPEFVVRADPDLIMVGDATFAGMSERPGWAGMRAMRSGRVCVFDPVQSDLMVRAGPRIAEAAHAMAACLQRHFP